MEKDIGELYADISACILAIANALEKSGAVTKQALAEAFQERLLAMQPTGEPNELSPQPFFLLRELAVALPKAPAL